MRLSEWWDRQLKVDDQRLYVVQSVLTLLHHSQSLSLSPFPSLLFSSHFFHCLSHSLLISRSFSPFLFIIHLLCNVSGTCFLIRLDFIRDRSRVYPFLPYPFDPVLSLPLPLHLNTLLLIYSLLPLLLLSLIPLLHYFLTHPFIPLPSSLPHPSPSHAPPPFPQQDTSSYLSVRFLCVAAQVPHSRLGDCTDRGTPY